MFQHYPPALSERLSGVSVSLNTIATEDRELSGSQARDADAGRLPRRPKCAKGQAGPPLMTVDTPAARWDTRRWAPGTAHPTERANTPLPAVTPNRNLGAHRASSASFPVSPTGSQLDDPGRRGFVSFASS
jgi:hypothetical protein